MRYKLTPAVSPQQVTPATLQTAPAQLPEFPPKRLTHLKRRAPLLACRLSLR